MMIPQDFINRLLDSACHIDMNDETDVYTFIIELHCTAWEVTAKPYNDLGYRGYDVLSMVMVPHAKQKKEDKDSIADTIDAIVKRWREDPDAWGDTDKDYRNMLLDMSQAIREGKSWMDAL